MRPPREECDAEGIEAIAGEKSLGRWPRPVPAPPALATPAMAPETAIERTITCFTSTPATVAAEGFTPVALSS